MNVLNHYGVVLSGQDVVEYAKRRGLCLICGRTQTHKRPNNLFKKLRNQWQPLTIMDESDDGSFSQMYLVYKGYCLQPTCYTLEEAKRELGEIVVERCDSSRKSVNSEQISESMRRFSSAKFSLGSAKSYEFSILDPKMSNPPNHSRLLRPNQLFPTSSNLSDVSSLGASAVSEEEDNPFLQDFNAQHIMSPHKPQQHQEYEQHQQQPSESDWVADFFPFPQTNSAFQAARPEPPSKKVTKKMTMTASAMKSMHATVDDQTDSMSKSETTEGDESAEESLASQVAPRALLQEQPTSRIILPSEYDVNVSKSWSNILTIQRGSLEALDLITNACGRMDLQGQLMSDKSGEPDHEEEGFEVAFADDMLASGKKSLRNEVCPENGLEVEFESGKQTKDTVRPSPTKKVEDRPAMPARESSGVLTLFQSAPLAYVHPETRQKYTFPLLDFAYESHHLTQSLQDAKRIGISVRVETEIATVDRLSAFFAQGGRKVLHLSCHGHPEYLLLENGYGSAHPLLVKDLKRFVSKADLDLVFISACYSRSAGEAFLHAGVKHVVCCRQDSLNVRDEAAADFARHFYRALACRKPLKEAFELAKATIGVSPLFPNAEEESDKFLLLPECCDPSYHDIQISFQDRRRVDSSHGDGDQSAPCLEMLSRTPERFIGREDDLFQILDAIRCTDWLHVLGERGVGKTTLVATASAYISRRQSSFMRDRIVWIKGPSDAKQYKRSIRRASGIRPLIIFDTRMAMEGWGMPKQLQFLRDLFANGSTMKLVTIGFDDTFVHRLREESPVAPRTMRVGRMNHHDSVCLFSSLASSRQLSPQELAATLAMSDSNNTTFEFQDDNALDPTKTVIDALHNFRKKKVYHRIGEGLPKRIVHFASSMNEVELADCVRWANRQNEDENGSSSTIPTTRAELEELIRCTLAKEARALREEEYSKARNFREKLEEWQSLRSILPTREVMEQELRSLYPKLQEAIRQRQYNEAEAHRTRRNFLEKQLHREEDYLQVEERFQQARIRARDMSFQSGGSVCSRSSYRSQVSNGSRASRTSTLSAASRSSRRSHISASSRTSVRSRISARSQNSSFSRSSSPKHHSGGGTVRGTRRMFV